MKTAYLIAVTKNISIPHFGAMFTMEEVYNLLKNEEFKIVKNKNGKPYRGVKVSESKKWLLINQRYYPIPLIAHYYPKYSVFCLVDGSYITMEPSMEERSAKDQVLFTTHLFGPYAYKDGDNPDKIIIVNNLGNPVTWQQEFWYQRAFVMVKKEIERRGLSFAQSDWKLFRYSWERTLADIEYKPYTTASERQSYLNSIVNNNNKIFDKMNSAVLDDRIIDAIAVAVRKDRRVNTASILNKKAYIDPLYVCNAVRVLERLDDKMRIKGLPFLMDCMDAIDEPYYEMASQLLFEIDKEKVIPALEDSFKAALGSENVLKIAGLMALGERIGHPLVQE